MHKLGIIGGMSWVSTRTYYEEINRLVQARTDKRHSAPLLIDSLDFSQMYRLQEDADWERAAGILSQSARTLEAGGAGALLIAANSMHKVYDQVAGSVSVPIFHIAEAVGKQMAADGVETAALFGTRNVMTESFYRRRLERPGRLRQHARGALPVGVFLQAVDLREIEAVDQQRRAVALVGARLHQAVDLLVVGAGRDPAHSPDDTELAQ